MVATSITGVGAGSAKKNLIDLIGNLQQNMREVDKNISILQSAR